MAYEHSRLYSFSFVKTRHFDTGPVDDFIKERELIRFETADAIEHCHKQEDISFQPCSYPNAGRRNDI